MVQVTPLRRLALTLSAASAVAGSLGAGSVTAHAGPGPVRPHFPPPHLVPPRLAPPPVRDEDRPASGDHLTVTVRGAGGGADGTFTVRCRPDRGTHPDVPGACAAVDRNTRWGRDPFAPVPEGGVCTMRYGGPATAHVTGRWAGRPVDTVFERGNGCQIERWDRFVPLLPGAGRAPSRP
ncbi:SSI family serine proteinase inhibitor [Streptomyces sp. NPDC101213]|uniref:SSI family serine proteinase inhibitor n=1 Tax=Streptomyces sp. NPDC101213 TaxID=3366130 RepID=UPI00382F0F15